MLKGLILFLVFVSSGVLARGICSEYERALSRDFTQREWYHDLEKGPDGAAYRFLANLKVGEEIPKSRLPKDLFPTAERAQREGLKALDPIQTFWGEIQAQDLEVEVLLERSDGDVIIIGRPSSCDVNGNVSFGNKAKYFQADRTPIQDYPNYLYPPGKIKTFKLISPVDYSRLKPIEISEIHFEPLDLENLIQRSGLRGQDQYDTWGNFYKTLVSGKAKLMTTEEFAKQSGSYKGGYLLGMADDIKFRPLPYDQMYRAYSKAYEMVDFHEGYSQFHIALNESDHTNKYLTQLAASGKPIVFLAPTEEVGKSHGFTSLEFNWLLEHPEVLSRTTVVFGYYTLFGTQLLAHRAMTSHHEIESLLVQTLRDYSHHVSAPH